VVETWRERIDGKYWFPTYSYANDELFFDAGNTLKIKLRVRYTDFKEATSTVRVLDDDEVVTEDPPAPKKP
jgi:hypothetical protein